MANKRYSDVSPEFGDKDCNYKVQQPSGKTLPKSDPSGKDFKPHPHRADETKGKLPGKGAKK